MRLISGRASATKYRILTAAPRFRLIKKHLNSRKVLLGLQRANIFFLLAPTRCSNSQALAVARSFRIKELPVTVFKPSSRLLQNHPRFANAAMGELGVCTLVCGRSSCEKPAQQLSFFIQRAQELETLVLLASTWVNRSVLDSARLKVFEAPFRFDIFEILMSLWQKGIEILCEYYRSFFAKTLTLARL